MGLAITCITRSDCVEARRLLDSPTVQITYEHTITPNE